VLGAAVGLVGSGLLIDAFGFRAMALVMAALALGFRYMGMLAVWNRVRRDQPPAELSFRDSLRATFSNTHFLRFLPTFVLFQVGLTMLTGLLPYYVNAVLEKEEEGVWVALLTAVAIGAMVAAVPFFARLARETSKQHAYSTAMLAAALAFPVLFVAGYLPGIPPLAQVIGAMLLVGAPLAGVYLFPAPIIADICDHDATVTGMRREATFFGAQAFVEKATGALAPLLLALVLLLGNSAADPLGVRLVGPVAGLVVLGGYLIFRGYTLPDAVPHQPRQVALAGELAGDP
jgi:GPH family glycoside/pentoside/hexuronide:cation symporter